MDLIANLFSDPEVMHYIEDGALSCEKASKYADVVIGLTEFSIYHGWWPVSRREDAARLGLVHLGKFRNVPMDEASGDDLQIVTSLPFPHGDTDTRPKP